MKTNAPQYDLPGQEHAFNLAGEVIKQPERKPTPKADPQTGSLFAPLTSDDFERWLNLQIMLGFTVKNPDAIEKIRIALKAGATLTQMEALTVQTVKQ